MTLFRFYFQAQITYHPITNFKTSSNGTVYYVELRLHCKHFEVLRADFILLNTDYNGNRYEKDRSTLKVERTAFLERIQILNFEINSMLLSNERNEYVDFPQVVSHKASNLQVCAEHGFICYHSKTYITAYLVFSRCRGINISYRRLRREKSVIVVNSLSRRLGCESIIRSIQQKEAYIFGCEWLDNFLQL